MTRLAWFTDPHLNHVGLARTEKFGRYIKSQADACVITGDIADGVSDGITVCDYLSAFQKKFQNDAFFCLGNHCIWGSSFKKTHADIRSLCRSNPKLHWLGDGGVYQIGDTQLCGTDGWYDYQAGDCSTRMTITMNDWQCIDEFKQSWAIYKNTRFSQPLIDQFRALGQESAVKAREVLALCDKTKPTIFATHVPPFEGASWNEGKLSPYSTMPFYSNVALGYVLNQWAEGAHKLTTICGHAHSKGTYQARENHLVLTGEADYGQPRINKVFHL